MGRYDNARLVADDTGEEIKQGARVPTFRGWDTVEFLYVTRLPGGGSTGKILVADSEGKWEYYPGVVCAHIEVTDGE